MANVQIRNVPDDMHQALKARAAASGVSLNEYLLRELEAIASKPTWPEMLALLEEQEPYTGPSAAEFIRHDRDSR